MKEQIIEMLEQGTAPAKVRAFLVFQEDMTESKARELVNETMDELGITRQSKVDMEALVRTIRENANVPRKELKTLVAEASGCTESTANHMLSAVNFAKEWTKQELES